MYETVPHVAATNLGALIELGPIRVHLELQLILLPDLLILCCCCFSLGFSLVLMVLKGCNFQVLLKDGDLGQELVFELLIDVSLLLPRHAVVILLLLCFMHWTFLLRADMLIVPLLDHSFLRLILLRLLFQRDDALAAINLAHLRLALKLFIDFLLVTVLLKEHFSILTLGFGIQFCDGCSVRFHLVGNIFIRRPDFTPSQDIRLAIVVDELLLVRNLVLILLAFRL